MADDRAYNRAAAAAAAATAAAAALTLRNQTITTAEKQLEAMYKTVESLQKVGFPKFQEQLLRQAFAYEWGGFILDATQPVPGPNVITLKEQRDVRDAYLLITTKCDGHLVENILESVPQGDAQAAFVAVCDYFHWPTQSGKTTAYKDFFGASMASTISNITEWIAVVPRLAENLIACGGQADATAQLSIFLDDLLPEFALIKVFLDQAANPDYNDAARRTLDFASNNSLKELTKNGLKHSKNNTFTVGEANRPPGLRSSPPSTKCRGWVAATGCRYGKQMQIPPFRPWQDGACAPTLAAT